MAARTNKVTLTETWKSKIKASMIANRLKDHVLGKIEMKPTQIMASRILMDKLVSNAPQETRLGNPDGTPLISGINVGFIEPNS